MNVAACGCDKALSDSGSRALPQQSRRSNKGGGATVAVLFVMELVIVMLFVEEVAI